MDSKLKVATRDLYEAVKFVARVDHAEAPLVEFQIDPSGAVVYGRGSTVTMTARVPTSALAVTEPFAFSAPARAFEAFAYVLDSQVELSIALERDSSAAGNVTQHVRLQFETVDGAHAGATGERLCPAFRVRAPRTASSRTMCDVTPLAAALRSALRAAAVLEGNRGAILAIRDGQHAMYVHGSLPRGRFALEAPGMKVPAMTLTIAQARLVADAIDSVVADRLQREFEPTLPLPALHAEFGRTSDHELAIELPNATTITVTEPAAMTDAVETNVTGRALRFPQQIRSAIASEDCVVEVAVDSGTRCIHVRSPGARSAMPLADTEDVEAMNFRVDAGVLARVLHDAPDRDHTVHVDIDRRELFHQRSIRANASQGGTEVGTTTRLTFVLPIQSVRGAESAT